MNPTPQQIQALRKQAGLTVLELANLLEVSKPTVDSWLYGARNCPAPVFRLMTILIENLEDRK